MVTRLNKLIFTSNRIIMKYLLPVFFVSILFATRAEAKTNQDSVWMVRNYTKRETYVPMRDGVKLYTAIYEPKSNKERHPILINRTPYSIAPYGPDKYRANWNNHYMEYFKRGYIMVLQDVRGRMMSEGEFMDVRPFNPHKQGIQTDEASDTYDLIDWLLANTKGNNGRVGIYGISYPGYYATMGALCGHPALKASSPQAPVTEWFLGDDFHHNGAFMEMDAFGFYSSFGKPRPKPTTKGASGFQFPYQDKYKFYLEAGPLRNLAALMGDSVKFWNELYSHPNYDEWWQNRNTRKFVQHIPASTATLVVGGLFDAEDCFGAWELYKSIEKKAHNNNKLVMGPWSHGGWARGTGDHLGNVRFGSETAKWYQQNVEIPYFEYHLRDRGLADVLAEATIFFTGSNEWRRFNQWPPAKVSKKKVFLHTDGSLNVSLPQCHTGYREYMSDPAKPVPFIDGIITHRTAEYMTDDQRFASTRPDVLTFTSKQLNRDVTVAGTIVANLFTSISSTDADYVVKVIDVFPDDFSYETKEPKTYPMGGYQMLVRGEIMRGRYRNSFQFPQAITPGEVTEVSYKLPDIAHVFRKGHRIMVQVQSSWFPLADRNPQQFVNIYKARKEDFISSLIRIHTNVHYPSNIELPVLPALREISDAEVEGQIQNRIEYFISVYGSREKLEKASGKTIAKLKDDYREIIREQMLAARDMED